jgi:hypothetical protein
MHNQYHTLTCPFVFLGEASVEGIVRVLPVSGTFSFTVVGSIFFVKVVPAINGDAPFDA